MNRMSLLFAALIAASFLVSSPPSANVSPRTATALSGNRSELRQQNDLQSKLQDPSAAASRDAASFIHGFLNDVGLQHDDRSASHLDVLFATVPDPVETHLAAAFDHNLAAIQDAIQDSGYLFDSSWIPWQNSQVYDRLTDTVLAARIRAAEHEYPGILLFRQNPMNTGDRSAGLIVFLFAEKPTAGIDSVQVRHAVEIMKGFPYSLHHEIRILGPNFTGSLASLTPMVAALAEAQDGGKPSQLRVLIRSGGFTGEEAADRELLELQARMPAFAFDLGSANHPYEYWIGIAVTRLCAMGIDHSRIGILAEDESLFGGNGFDDSKLCPKQSYLNGKLRIPAPQAAIMSFPRDISTLRASYEEQGVLERSAPSTEIRRYLHLNEDADKEGDTVHEYGGPGTVAAKESVLFGISNFLRSHGIAAVIVVATNEEDRYFLARFLHANDDGVRVVILGATRLFMRGSTAQFRGDLMISDFPMLSRVYQWTLPCPADGCSVPHPLPVARIFPDDYSHGNYIAALDLLDWPQDVEGHAQYAAPPEYSAPPWGDSSAHPELMIAPPMYLSGLGGDATWPVWEDAGSFISPSIAPKPTQQSLGPTSAPRASTRTSSIGQSSGERSPEENRFGLAMPFLFGQHFGVKLPEYSKPAQTQLLTTGHLWKVLEWFLLSLNLVFVLAMLYANPVLRRKFAYLQPTSDWRYWLFAVAVPSFASGLGFLVLAWAHRFPDSALQVGYRRDFVQALWWAVGVAWLPAAVVGFKIELEAIRTSKSKKSKEAKATAQAIDGRTHVEPPPKASHIFEKEWRWLALGWGCVPALIITGSALSFHAWQQRHTFSIGEILNIYREMYWESGLSLVPTALLLVLALVIWAYFAAAGFGVLRQTWILPDFGTNQRISHHRGEQICFAGYPLPTRGALWYWMVVLICFLATLVIGLLWPSLRYLTTLEDMGWTHDVKAMGLVILVCFYIDLLQFAWLWAELRELLEALDREHFRRSFVPLREFSWNSLWQFSGGSFQDRRNLLAAQYACLEHLAKEHPELFAGQQPEDIAFGEAIKTLRAIREDYMRLQIKSNPTKYGADMDGIFLAFSTAGSVLARRYLRFCQLPESKQHKTHAVPLVDCGNASKDRFKEEEEQVVSLPAEEQCIERFLCLIYVAFIQTTIVRLRGLAFSFVSIFFVLMLSVAIYPFQPLQTLLTAGFAIFVAMAITVTVVYSQMDKEPVLSRILNSDPNKLEKSFYGKLIETLALPLLPLLAQLLPGGAGRLIDVVGRLLNHGQ
ncbi:MAG: hypothetical protein ACLGSD_17335 [Acidobacteriota bacterium]